MAADIIPGFEETDADRAFQPAGGCCEDCDEALDFAGWQCELAAGAR